MITHLRMPDEIYDHELDQICLPQRALAMMHAALADPHACFYNQILEFLNRNYNADASQMEYAFQLLQQDLARGWVLISRRLMDFPAFRWIPPEGDDKGRWQLSTHALPEHHSILQLTLDHAKTLLPFPGVAGATETPSAIGRAVDKVVGAAKQMANDLANRARGDFHADMAANGSVYQDSTTGAVLTPDEVKQRWENEGRDTLPAAGADQQAGAQWVKDTPVMSNVVGIAQTAASRGRNIVQHPGDFADDIAKALKNLRGPKDKQLSEALGKIGGEQAKRRQGVETDPRYVDRYHGPDDMTRDNDDGLAEWEFKGNKTDSKSVAKDSNNNRQGSVEKNKRRSEKVAIEKAKKIGQPSSRQGGPYTTEEIALWNEVKDQEGKKQHFSVHTNTETGVVRTYKRNDKGKTEALIDEFTIENFDLLKSTLKDFLK